MSDTPASKRPPRILVVDDEERVGHVLSQHFSARGYEVRAVRRGEEAIAISAAFSPDVVVLDLLMPGMNGIETLRELKQLQPPPKIIMLSAADHEEVAQGAVHLGADFYASKPINLVELERLIHGFCPTPTPSN